MDTSHFGAEVALVAMRQLAIDVRDWYEVVPPSLRIVSIKAVTPGSTNSFDKTVGLP